jgi:Ataxin-3
MISGDESSKAFNPDTVWIYHERQQALLCGQHALNNLAQNGEVFKPYELAVIAQQLDDIELQFLSQSNEGGVRSPDYIRRLMEGSQHVNAMGNFSIEVLKAALQQRYGIQLPHLSHADLASSEITEFQGFLCHKSDHWFAIRRIGRRFWNLNSTLERPIAISHFKLATEMRVWQNEGYTIFCVPSGLPEGGSKPAHDQTASSNYIRWHRMSDLLRGKSTAKDPWDNVGSGIRLDERRANGNSVDNLTEEEQLMLALQYSIEQTQKKASDAASVTAIPVPEEPAANTPGSVRIQFRLPPDGRKPSVRRFLQTDPVGVIYSFVQRELDSSREFELLYGFPPKDLSSVRTQTMGGAKLANESIICRYL